MCRSRQSKAKKSDVIVSTPTQSSSQYSQNDGDGVDMNGKKKSRGKLALPGKGKK